MKRIWVVITAVMLVLLLGACGSAEPQSNVADIFIECIEFVYDASINRTDIEIRARNNCGENVDDLTLTVDFLDENGDIDDTSYGRYQGYLENGQACKVTVHYEGIPGKIRIASGSFKNQEGSHMSFHLKTFGSAVCTVEAQPEETTMDASEPAEDEKLYYSNGQIQKEIFRDGDGNITRIEEFYQNGIMEKLTQIDGNSQYTMTFDERGNKISAMGTSGGQLDIIEYWENRYDAQDRLLSVKNLNKEGTVLYEAYYVYHGDGTYTVDSTEYRGIRIYEYEFAERDVDSPMVHEHYITHYSADGCVIEQTEAEIAGTSKKRVDMVAQKRVKAVDGGLDHTVILYSDGRVEAIGDNSYGQCDVSEWTDITQISAMKHHTVGLRSDGTVVATGLNTDGQCAVFGWSGIVEVSAGEHHTVGLRADGTVVAAGRNQSGECDLSDWTDIVSVGAAYTNTVGLRKDGTVVVSGSFKKGALNWENIVQISVSDAHFVGLRADGTAVATGSNNHKQCDLSGWRDLIQISTGCAYTTGLKADGTVVFKGLSDRGQAGAKQWKNVVYIGNGLEHTIGILNNGTLVAAGANDKGQCSVG